MLREYQAPSTNFAPGAKRVSARVKADVVPAGGKARVCDRNPVLKKKPGFERKPVSKYHAYEDLGFARLHVARNVCSLPSAIQSTPKPVRRTSPSTAPNER